jgi:hypothetical protein
MRERHKMSIYRAIPTSNNKSIQQKAKEVNERRRQAQAFLRRNSEQKKPGAPHRSVTQTPDGSHSAAAESGPQSFGGKK